MALWQVGFFVLPGNCISEISSLEISDEFFFDDAPFWEAHKTDVAYFKEIGLFLPETKSWSNQITLYGNQDSNRFQISSENETVVSVSFRIDFTSDYDMVFRSIIEFCALKGLIILNENLEVVPLNYESARHVIENAPQVELYRKMKEKNSD